MRNRLVQEPARPWVLAYAAILTLLLLAPADDEWHAQRVDRLLEVPRDLPVEALLADAAVNFAAFVPLGALVLAAVHRSRRSRRVAITLGTVAAFALTMESLQYVLGWRHSSMLDVVADVIGGLAGMVLAALAAHGRRTSVPDAARPG